MSVVVFASVSLGLASLDRVSADSSKKNNNTVYYVYLEDEYVGTISDKDIIEKLKDKKISEFKDEMDKKYKLTVGSDLTLIPEQVGSEAKTNDREVIQKLDEQLAVEAEATAIVLDGKAAVYVLDKNSRQSH